jgi:peroxiredoxin
MALKPGDKAPSFKLFSSDKQEVSLDDFKGQNVVLLFFPFAFSRVCTAELCGIRDDIAFYQNLDAQVLAVSADSLYTLNRYKEDQNLNFLLLSDFNKEVSRAYDSIFEEYGYGMKGVSKRSAFVIDREGIIRYAEVLEKAGDLPNFDAVKETLNRLIE